MFEAHGYLQHPCSLWTGYLALRYHTYLIPEKSNLKEAVAFAYGASLAQDRAFSRGKVVLSYAIGGVGVKMEGMRIWLMMEVKSYVIDVLIEK